MSAMVRSDCTSPAAQLTPWFLSGVIKGIVPSCRTWEVMQGWLGWEMLFAYSSRAADVAWRLHHAHLTEYITSILLNLSPKARIKVYSGNFTCKWNLPLNAARLSLQDHRGDWAKRRTANQNSILHPTFAIPKIYRTLACTVYSILGRLDMGDAIPMSTSLDVALVRGRRRVGFSRSMCRAAVQFF